MIHEKRYAHSTLKNMNKKRLIELIDLYLDHNDGLHETIDRQYEYCQLLLKENDHLENEVRKYKEHNIELMNYITQIEREFKDNPPLKFEEIKADMWIWDNRLKTYLRVISVNPYAFWNIDVYTDCTQDRADKVRFEENKFYRREVKE